ncbi:M48 family metallopeptidase [Chroogloeocystis siderophila]|jgi:predicted Zn-dependent protease|uniref:Peptidase M48 Ste24p n=1 Tax=Chroogloeocystis siderophila 5.2 s.c.1 TaxID=247279 RepID=A0A1U7HLC0_9CHRO|nr:M48 family metallopeptidase [Chroogloeocystis siderophila]OKH24354.1 peptidase M48 Ste24p [Chroogloeocystis siderophila 5.2 s.c.1]
MKPIWKSLLLSLNAVLFSTGTSIVLAEPVKDASPSAIVVPVVGESIHPEVNATSQSKPPASTQEIVDKLNAAAKLSPEEIARQQKISEADRLYLGGQFAAAEKLYREVKTPFTTASTDVVQRPPAIVDPAQLPPAGKVYWREAEAAFQHKVASRMMVPLRLLVEQYPEFIPGHLRLAEALQKFDHNKEAIAVLERAVTLYPDQPDLVKAKVTALAQSKQWMEASLAARQFALLRSSNAEHANEFIEIADSHLERYQKHLRRELTGNTIANILTGALGYALTGNLLGPFSAVQTTAMLLRGESAVGESVANQAREQLEIVTDKAVVDYVNEIGQRLAQVAGRNDFKYEFYVVLDKDLNAFALPGGKVFINAGAITSAQSEAELAGLLAHELAHTVLSHGFQLVAEGNLVANVTQFFPYGGTVANLVSLNYSREMEQQADVLGTRLLASTGYAADGLRNLMVTLQKEETGTPFTWLSSHPATSDRIRYLESIIQRYGYNRYAYEGVTRHNQIKQRVEKLLQAKQSERKKHQR